MPSKTGKPAGTGSKNPPSGRSRVIASSHSEQIAPPLLHEPPQFSFELIQGFSTPALLLDAATLMALEANHAAGEFYGVPPSGLCGTDFLSYFPAAERTMVREKLQPGNQTEADARQTLPDGEHRQVRVEAVHGLYSGSPAILCLIRDETGRSEMLNQLMESSVRNQEIIRDAQDIVYLHDLQGRFLYANRAVTHLLGHSEEDITRLTVQSIVHPEDLPRTMESIRAKMEGRPVPNPYSVRVITQSGEVRTLEISSRLIERDGNPVAIQGIARDVSAKIAVESALRESEARFRAVAESAPCAIVINQDSRLRYVNTEAIRITGNSREELLALEHFWDLATPEFQDIVRSRSQARLLGEEADAAYQFTIRTKAGDIRWVDFTLSHIQYDGRPAVVCMLFDITDRKRSEQALVRSEKLFRSVIEHAADLICILDREGVIRYISPSVMKLLGFDAEEVKDHSAFDYVHPGDMQNILHYFQRGFALDRGHTAVELRLRHRNGNWVEFEAMSTTMFEAETPNALLVSFRNVSERKLQEQQLRASEERFRQLFERNLAGVFRCAIDGKILACNLSFATILGMSSVEEALQHSAWDFSYSDEDRTDYLDRLRRRRLLTNVEERVRRTDGKTVWILENVVLVPGENGEPDIIEGTMMDITERKETERALKESEAKFRAVADTAASAIYIHNGQRFLYVNRASEEISGYSAEELEQLEPWKLVHPDDYQLVLERGQARRRGESPSSRYEYRIVKKNGEVVWVDFSASVVEFGGEKAVLGTAFDITERKRAESIQSAMYRIAEQANEAEDLQEFFAAVHAIVSELMVARNFYFALYDERKKTITYPYYADELDPPPTGDFPLGKGRTEYVLQKGQAVLLRPEDFDALAKRGEVEMVGSPCVDWMGAPLRSGSHQLGVMVVQSYNTAERYNESQLEVLNFVARHVANALLRKRNEAALRDSEQRFRNIVQSAVYGIYRSSVDGRFLDVNPAMVKMLGYATEDELLALDLNRDLYEEPEERARLVEQCLRTGVVKNVEVRWRRKDRTVIAIRLSGRAVMGDDERISSFEMIAEDTTERRGLEEQLRQSQKMEAIGRLAGGIAHDFNNLLTVIKGYSDLMIEEFRESDPMRGEIEEIRKAADRAATLTRQLLAFSRQQVLAPKVLDLNHIVSNMDRLLRRILGADITLSTMLDPQLGQVRADPGQIEQVIMNLAVNARDAMPVGGKLIIETTNIEVDEAFVRDHVGAKPGSFVVLSVADTGVGMSEEVRQRIFEPFYTTKEAGKGTGLGLSTVYGIVKQSDGYVWVESEQAKGSRFKVYLPRVHSPAEAEQPKAAVPIPHRGHETVLVVEDEDGVRALIRQLLHKHGYTILEARHGGEAILHCERHPGRIELLLTDVVLEHMGGPELATRLTAMRPDMKVLYISGYTDDAIIHQGVDQKGTAFLQKPFTTSALTKKVRQVLDA